MILLYSNIPKILLRKIIMSMKINSIAIKLAWVKLWTSSRREEMIMRGLRKMLVHRDIKNIRKFLNSLKLSRNTLILWKRKSKKSKKFESFNMYYCCKLDGEVSSRGPKSVIKGVKWDKNKAESRWHQSI